MERMNQEERNDNRLTMIGKVAAIDPEKARVRVIFPDRDDLMSKWLPLQFLHTWENMKVYAMPDIDEEVVCSFLANGLEEGFVVGSYYDDKNPPPTKDEKKKLILFNKVDYVMYKEGHMEAKANTIKMIADVTIEGTLNVTQPVTAPLFIGTFDGPHVGGGDG